jgi:hypothetical protein
MESMMRRSTLVLALLAVIALPTTATTAAGATSGPRVLSFVETPTTLLAAGGRVAIMVKLKGAQVCQLELLSATTPEPTWSHEGQRCVTTDEQRIRIWPNATTSPEAITFKLVVSFFPENKGTQLNTTRVFTVSVAGKAAPTTTTTAATTSTTTTTAPTVRSTTTPAALTGHGDASITLTWGPTGTPTSSEMTYAVTVYPWEERLGGDPTAPPSVSGSVSVTVDGAVACDLPVTMTAAEDYGGQVDCVVAISSAEVAAALTATYYGDDGSMGSVSGTVTPGSFGEVRW